MSFYNSYHCEDKTSNNNNNKYLIPAQHSTESEREENIAIAMSKFSCLIKQTIFSRVCQAHLIASIVMKPIMHKHNYPLLELAVSKESVHNSLYRLGIKYFFLFVFKF